MYHDPKLKMPAAQKSKLNAWGREIGTKSTPRGASPALTARLNVTDLGLENEVFAEITLSLLSGGHGQILSTALDQLRTNNMTRSQVQAALHSYRYDLSDLPPAHFDQAYVTPPENYPGPVSCAGYAVRLLSREGDAKIVAIFEDKLSLCHESHAEDLERLRAWNPEIYRALITGNLADALRQAQQLGYRAISLVRPIVENHAMMLSVATAHVRMAQLAQCAKAPMGCAYSGEAKWPTMASVARAALVSPAQSIRQLLTLQLDENTTHEQAVGIAQECGLLGDDASSHILISMAKDIERQLPEHSLARARVHHTAREILKAIDPLRALKASDLSEAGWMRRSFVRERFGVEATEGAALVAMNLLMQRGRIHACVEAVLSDEKLPSFEFKLDLQLLSKNSLRRLTEALRIAGNTDKAAPKELSAPENNTAKKLVNRTLAKVEQGLADRAIATLRIDPAFFFCRAMAPSTSANRDACPRVEMN
jgi:hypothetical protein